jgi:hypothetical protein
MASSESSMACLGSPFLRFVRARLVRRTIVRGCVAGMAAREEE